MRDSLIFYSIKDGKIFVLSGQIGTSRSKYTTFDYSYDNPVDDSSIVDIFNKELGNLIISPDKLLEIIKKTKYPHFIKHEQNGLTYIIKVDFVDNDTLNNILGQYQSSYFRLYSTQLRWNALKWFPLDEFDTIKSQMTVAMQSIITKYNLPQFLKNQTQIDFSKLTEQDYELISKIIKQKKEKLQKLAQLKEKWEKFVEAQAMHLKNYSYTQIVTLYEYTSSSAYEINVVLRNLLRFGKKSYSKVNFKELKNIHKNLKDAITILSIIETAPRYSEFAHNYLSVYRGLSFDPLLKIGQTTDIFKYNFNSTSLDIDVTANMFVPQGGSLFKIIITPDTLLLVMSIISHYSYEDEILLPPGLTFRVIDKKTYHNTYLNIDQTYYIVVLQNTTSYLDNLVHFELDIYSKIKSIQPKTEQKKESTNIPKILPPKKPFIKLSKDQFKKAHIVIKKLIDLINGLFEKDHCKKNYLVDPLTTICYPINSKHATYILSEQLGLLIAQKSILSTFFDYSNEIALFIEPRKQHAIEQLIYGLTSKLFNRASEEINPK